MRKKWIVGIVLMFFVLNTFGVSFATTATEGTSATDIAPSDTVRHLESVGIVSGGAHMIGLQGDSSTSGTGYYIVLPAGTGRPMDTEVKSGRGPGGISPVTSGTVDVTEGQIAKFNIGSLSSSTSYDFYFAFTPDNGQLDDHVLELLSYTTLGIPAVSYSSGITVKNIAGQTVTMSSTEPGLVILIKDDANQSSFTMMNLGVLSNTAAIDKISTKGGSVAISTENLKPGTYYGYAVTPMGELSSKSNVPVTIIGAEESKPVEPKPEEPKPEVVADLTKEDLDVINEDLDKLKEVEEVYPPLQEKLTEVVDLMKKDNESDKLYELIPSFADTFDKTGGLMDKLTDDQKEKIANSIANLIKAIKNSYGAIEADKNLSAMTITNLEKLYTILQKLKIDSTGLENVKKSILELTEKTIDRETQLNVAQPTVVKEDGTNEIVLEEKNVEVALNTAKANIEKLSDTAKNIGAGDVPKKEIKKLDIVVSDKIENIENFELTLKKETLEKIKEGEYLEVNVKVKGVGFTLNKEIIEKPTEDVTFTAKKIDMLEVDVPKGTEQLAVPVAREFTLEKNKEEIETLEKPVKLYFYLSDLGLENLKPEEIKDIYVHVYDEKEKVWKPVAGKYDPVEKVIMVYRLHMSKYSLLKSSQSYSDLENEEAKEIINDMLRSGISNESELFNPGNSVTREEFAAWISRTFSLDQKDLVLKFEDIDKSNPYYNEIANAFNQGLISGKSASLFDPKGEITREEMATLINRAVNNYYEVELIDYSVIDTEYTDVASTANWASDNVKKILNLNLMSLDSDKNFNSKTPVKKSEAAEILSKLQGYQ